MPARIIKDDGSLDYEALGVEPPKHSETEFDRSMLQRATPIRWFQRGNELVAETELGELVNYSPTNMQLTGTDENNNPILTPIDI